MQLRLSLTLGVIALSLVGCARFGMGNGSLNYKQTQEIAPLKVPDNLEMRPQQSLYPAPRIDARALEEAPDFSNKYGNRFEMPRPEINTDSIVHGVTGSAPSQPEMITDGNGIPLMKVDGSTTEVWKYVIAATSTANLKTEINAKTAYLMNVDYEGQEYHLRLSPMGMSNTLGVYDTDDKLVDAKLADELLALIYQNWPA